MLGWRLGVNLAISLLSMCLINVLDQFNQFEIDA